MNIKISNDTPDAERFSEWLKTQGHDARVINSSGNYVDGDRTSCNAEVNIALNAL